MQLSGVTWQLAEGGLRSKMNHWLAIVLTLVLSSWIGSAQDASPEKQEGPALKAQRPTAIYFHYALYFTPKPKGDPEAVGRDIMAADFAKELTYRDEDTKLEKGNYLAFRSLPVKKYEPPSVTYLQHKGFGISQEQREQLQDSGIVLLVDIYIIKPDNFEYLTVVNKMVGAIAEQTNGFIWDEETREMFSPLAWEKTRIPEADSSVALANTTLHGYEMPSKNYRAVSFGMRKLGLPDIVVKEFPKPFWTPTMSMMRFLVAYIGEPGPLTPKQRWLPQELKALLGLNLKLTEVPQIQLVPSKRDEGDPRNDLWTIDFNQYPGESYHEQQAHVIFKLFQPNDTLLGVWSQREELMELSKAARAKLAGKKSFLVDEGLGPEQRLVLKAFVGGEYLWVEFKSWKDDTLVGALLNEITADGSKTQGDSLSVPFDQIFDYLFVDGDGSQEGNETTKFMVKLRENDFPGALNPRNAKPSAKQKK